MAGGDQRAHAILPFEPDGDIGGDHHHGEHRGDHAVMEELVGNLGSHHIGAPVLVAFPQLGADGPGHRLVDIVLVLAGPGGRRLNPDQHATVDRPVALAAAEILHLDFGKAQAVDLGAQRADIDGLGGLDLHQHAAGEVDAEIESVQPDGEHRDNDQKPVQPERHEPVFDEIHIGGFRDESQQRHGRTLENAGGTYSPGPHGASLGASAGPFRPKTAAFRGGRVTHPQYGCGTGPCL